MYIWKKLGLEDRFLAYSFETWWGFQKNFNRTNFRKKGPKYISDTSVIKRVGDALPCLKYVPDCKIVTDHPLTPFSTFQTSFKTY